MKLSNTKLFFLGIITLFLLKKENSQAQGLQTFQGIRMYHPALPGQYISLIPPSGIASYSLSLPPAQGAANTFLINNASGNLSWTNGNTLFWKLGGNSATVDNTNNYIGTTDNVPLNFRVNGEKAGRIDHNNSNTFFGFRAGNSIAAGGAYNSAFGYEALFFNTTGQLNTAFGNNALRKNIGGGNNTAMGSGALELNTTGSENIAVGVSTMGKNTGGTQNTAVGTSSLGDNDTGGQNTGVGYQAGNKNTTGSRNNSVGAFSLLATTTGSDNTGVGDYAGATNETGSKNTFLGSAADAAIAHLSLTNATAIGYNAKVATDNSLVLGAKGANAVNVGIGTDSPWEKLAIQSDGDADIDVSIASNTESSVWHSDLAAGSHGTKIIPTAGRTLWGIEGETFVGGGTYAKSARILFETGATPSPTSAPGEMSFWTTPAGSTTLVERMHISEAGNIGLGISPIHPLHLVSGAHCTAAGTWTNASDARLKKNISPINYGLKEILQLRPVAYRMKSNDDKQVGFIAQEVQKVLPELVSGKEGNIEKGETLGLSYGNLTAVLTKAVQEQQTEIQTLKEENYELKKQVEQLLAEKRKTEGRLDDIEASLSKLLKNETTEMKPTANLDKKTKEYVKTRF
jgi:trimeric autotransporter adhesin